MLALEVVPLPVADVDRALAFYTQQVGFALDQSARQALLFRAGNNSATARQLDVAGAV